MSLSEAQPHTAPAAADDDERREREPATALDHLGHPVDGHHPVGQLEHARINLRFCHSISPVCQVRATALPSQALLGEVSEGGTEAPSELHPQSASTGRVGKRLHPPMVPVASAVEHHPLDPAGLGLLREERADRLRRGNVAAGRVLGPERLAAAVGGEERPPRVVVDELRIDMVEAPEHGEAGPRRGPAQGAPDPPVPPVARRPPLPPDHFAPAPPLLPTLRPATSSPYLMPLPLYGSGVCAMR